MSGRTLRRSLVGGVSTGALFVAVSLYQNLVVEQGAFSNPGPVLAMGVIGFTVGALAGPLAGGLLDHMRGRRGE